VQRLRPLRISRCPKERIAELWHLYEQNMPHGLPPDEDGHYREALQSDNPMIFLAEEGGRLVGTFGLSYEAEANHHWLSYLLVAPEDHRRGVGTTLLLASIALLPKARTPQFLCISAVPTALGFYHRFGFRTGGEWQHSSGLLLPLQYLALVPEMGESCWHWLVTVGATLPILTEDIPKTAPQAATP
jgi:GNAT superfamily N-acetyltransferase